MKQYLEIKEKYKDSILFFRLGDFYEMFFEDAVIASRVLEIALTGKNYGVEEKAPMCGVPYHSAENYIQKLISAGKRVAICEQVEDPKSVKGIVKREVIRVVTPGTNVNDQNLESYKNSYLMGLHYDEYYFISYIDVTTGEINVAKVDVDGGRDFILQLAPKEILLSTETVSKINKNKLLKKDMEILQNSTTITVIDHIVDGISKDHLKNISTDIYRIYGIPLDIILGYIKETQGTLAGNISSINVYEQNDYLRIDPNSKKNLELTENATTRQKKNSLFDILDYSTTSIGKRTLRKWIDNPINNIKKINHRLDLIEELNQSFDLRSDLNELLDEIYDMERITGKMSYGSLNIRDIVALRSSLVVLPKIKQRIFESVHVNLKTLIKSMEDLQDIYFYLQNVIVEEPSISIKEGEVIRSEYNEKLREYRFLESNSAQILQDVEQKARQSTGVKSLKIGYNKVFGYYFEITHTAAKDAVIPSDYIRKQTLSNAERYINQELKELEDKILGARQKIFEIQSEIFDQVKGKLIDNITRINRTAEIIGQLDALLSLSIASIERNMVRPKFNNEGKYEIIASRHPVIESILGEDNFVPNDILIEDDSRIQIITGPNMGGKSTYMRQVAIIAIMAHMGSFVTAKSANLPILDAVFTRVGASDDLSLGQSTFMVEMKEVSYILKNATQRSLIILDEVGRGTSTFDGMSIAWAIIEYLADKISSTTLFSTHYHEITDLEKQYPNIKNFYIAVDENGTEINFMHKIIRGKMDKSYGIHVAKIAGLPVALLKKANEKLLLLENKEGKIKESLSEVSGKEIVKQISFEDFSSREIIERLGSIDMDDISPKQAYLILEELKMTAKEGVI